jgi:signal transduction histidine kinase
VRIRTELEETLVARADAEALHQIVINLLDNAIKYGGCGTVTLRSRARDGRAVIEVEDEGPGIAGADRERVWEPFVRLHRSGATPGSGIGLAVVRELVVAHGGVCRVETGSRADGGSVEGNGCRVVVELPGGRLEGTAVQTRKSEATWPAS